ncbi:galactocerebrosidase-like isoform X1 [Biomphalaria glabrata]|uniref:galactosylceramidase n=1 Tax=Biomphalaria glabrata TaxID=6526 RepID=A0A9W3B5T6_BIOGL|nr:galactocerebrosidase-like isoform X1 [Biomphalaria glabrata]XP_055894903.1 galactocerebrosidase-like isoform X1 [Biomphalaria glabrata]
MQQKAFGLTWTSLILSLIIFVIIKTSKSNQLGYKDQYLVSNTSRTDQDLVFDDFLGFGRTFDGVGGLSGGGATSKLLVNYPLQQQNEILDFLFKPNFGASLQILKVEIGGDVQSTDGTEASHMHNDWDENYERGYEWWIMTEAKKRNPNIKLYGLPWGFPGWIGQGTRSPFAKVNVTADYIVRWVNGAKTHYNLSIDYIGIWNEKKYDITYIKVLREMLNQRGFQNVMIIAADKKWEIAVDIEQDPVLASSVHAIGCHYPGTYSTQEALNTNKQLWSSEDYSTFNDEVGGGCWARILNQNYVNGLMTSTISWNLLASYYQGLPYFRDGLMTAINPWSGYYEVNTPIWMTAHTTQFTSIGWRYLKHDSGVGKLPQGGSYVGLVSPDGTDLTIVIETMTRNHSKCIRPYLPYYEVKPQQVTITLKGSLVNVTQLNVWYSKLGFNSSPDIVFEKQKPIQLINGHAQINLGLDEVVTLTTLMRGQKGYYPQPPQQKSFPLPYSDNFEAYRISEEPFLLVPQIGSLEIIKSQSPLHGQVARQTILYPPIEWCPFSLSFPIAVIGNISWSDLFIQIEFEIPEINGTTGVFIATRVDTGGCTTFIAQGIFFFLLKDGSYILANDLARTKVWKQGLFRYQPGFHKVSLLTQGTQAIGFYDDQLLFNTTVSGNLSQGFAAIGTDSFGWADFDNLLLTSQADGIAILNKYHEIV